MDYLVSEKASLLRNKIIFKVIKIIQIVPMLNPDGVIIGNYRTGLQGFDYNREYKSELK